MVGIQIPAAHQANRPNRRDFRSWLRSWALSAIPESSWVSQHTRDRCFRRTGGSGSAQGVKASVADALEHLARNENAYGLIVAIDVIEHFSKEELIRLLHKVRAALKPNGMFLLQTPNGGGLLPNSIIYGDMTHFTILSLDSIRQVLRLVGFGQMQFFETGPVPKNVAGSCSFCLVETSPRRG